MLKSSKILLFLVLLTGYLTNGPARADQLLGEVRGWKIVYSDEYKGCITRGYYQDGTVLTYGFDGLSGMQFVSIGNRNWFRYPVNQNFKINFDVEGEAIFSGYFRSVIRGGMLTFENGSATDGFVEAIAAAMSMKVFLEADYLTSFSLRGTRAAFNAVKDCHYEP